MKKNILLLFIFVQLTISGFAQAEKTEKLILDLSKKKFEWMINKRYDSLEMLLDDQLKYIHSNGWIQSKKEMMEDFTSEKLTYQKVEVSESTVRLYDNTAIVTGKGKFSGAISDTPFAMELTYTEVYIHNNKKWLLASRHANKMP